MENITFHDLVSDNVKLSTVFDIIKIDEVNGIDTFLSNDKKVLKIKIGIFNYLFSSELKSIIFNKIKKDLNVSDYTIKFVV